MKRADLKEAQAFAIEDVDIPAIAPNEVLVRVAGSGVCASELETWLQGPPPGEVRDVVPRVVEGFSTRLPGWGRAVNSQLIGLIMAAELYRRSWLKNP